MSTSSRSHRLAAATVATLVVSITSSAVSATSSAWAAPPSRPAVTQPLTAADGSRAGCNLTVGPFVGTGVFEEVFGEVSVDSYTVGAVFDTSVTLACTTSVRTARIVSWEYVSYPGRVWEPASRTVKAGLATAIRAMGRAEVRLGFGALFDAPLDLAGISCDMIPSSGRVAVVAVVTDAVKEYRTTIRIPRVDVPCPLPPR